MDVEGIYRKSGGSSQVSTVKDAFERASPPTSLDCDLSDLDLDIHAVTSTVKQYFRKLPSPLITFDVYDLLLEANKVSDTSERAQAMRDALHQLPKVHLAVVEYLFKHLERVTQMEKVNLMTSTNIAVVFAPTIMRPESLAREMSDTAYKNEAVKFLVENCDRIFDEN